MRGRGFGFWSVMAVVLALAVSASAWAQEDGNSLWVCAENGEIRRQGPGRHQEH